jgi:hypothetical protein
MRPYPITERDKIGASLRQRCDLVEACGIADTGQFEQLRPPVQPFLDRVEGRTAAAPIGLAEHHIAGAGDAVGLERGKRGGQRLDVA